ncbi:MAG: SDR family oxidoreductase [Chloroflexota bacterium]
MRRYLITGSNRGIGLELTKQLVEQGHRVFATCRVPAQSESLQQLAAQYSDQLTVIALDVTDPTSIEEAHTILSQHTDALDVLINNAGILSDGDSIETLQSEVMMQNFAVNTIAPAMLVQRFLGLLERGGDPLVVNMSSSFASIGLKSEKMPPRYSYSMSKAALNMLSKTMALELKPLNITVIALHPGWVRTDLGGSNAHLSPSESVEGILQVMEKLSLDDAGKYLTWQGSEMPW